MTLRPRPAPVVPATHTPFGDAKYTFEKSNPPFGADTPLVLFNMGRLLPVTVNTSLEDIVGEDVVIEVTVMPVALLVEGVDPVDTLCGLHPVPPLTQFTLDAALVPLVIPDVVVVPVVLVLLVVAVVLPE